jgi:hypothetical protein
MNCGGQTGWDVLRLAGRAALGPEPKQTSRTMAALNIDPPPSTANGTIPCCRGGRMDEVIIQPQALSGWSL